MVWRPLLTTWLQTPSVPKAVLSHQGGEFQLEVKAELEALGARLASTAEYNPTQNADVERHGAVWKSHVKAIILELFVDFAAKRQSLRSTML